MLIPERDTPRISLFLRWRLDNKTVTVSSVAWTYGLNVNTLHRNYKEVLSGYKSWDHKKHAEDYVQNAANIIPLWVLIRPA